MTTQRLVKQKPTDRIIAGSIVTGKPKDEVTLKAGDSGALLLEFDLDLPKDLIYILKPNTDLVAEPLVSIKDFKAEVNVRNITGHLLHIKELQFLAIETVLFRGLMDQKPVAPIREVKINGKTKKSKAKNAK